MDITDLYQELIIDHGTEPRNYHELEGCSHHAEGFNPLCGDEIQLFLQLVDGKIDKASFTGKGCAISTASASIMTELLVGKTAAEAKALFDEFKHLVTTKAAQPPPKSLGKLIALSGVRVFPSRVKCATLAWHTLLAALEKNESVATTE